MENKHISTDTGGYSSHEKEIIKGSNGGPDPIEGHFDMKSDFFEVAPLAIIITDEKSQIININPMAEDLFGYSLQELTGRKIETLIPENLRKKHVDHRNQYIKTPYTRSMGIGMDLAGKKKNGDIVPVEIGISYQYQEDEIQIVCFINDISKRIRYEELLQKQNSFLSALHETSLSILGRTDLEQLLESIVTKAAGIMSCNHGHIYLLNKVNGKFEKRVGIGGFLSSHSTLDRVEEMIVSEVTDSEDAIMKRLDSDLNSEGDYHVDGISYIMGVPLVLENEIAGVICIAGEAEAKRSTNLISTEMMNYFGELASIALQNANLFSEVEKSREESEQQKKRMERELRIASSVQIGLLPNKYPDVKGWSFASQWKPAYEVAGDYYDFIIRKDGCIDIIIADVTDKGVPAALFMAHSKTLLRSSIESSGSLLESVNKTNAAIIGDDVGPFVTMFLARVNTKTGELSYINAGHEPAMIYKAKTNEIIELTKTGVPLGLDRDLVYDEEWLNLEIGDFIVLYTDGVSEAMNYEFKQFGKVKLKDAILALSNKPSEEIARGLLKKVEEHIGSSMPSDDIAILVVQREPL